MRAIYDKTVYKKAVAAAVDAGMVILGLWLFAALWYKIGSDGYRVITSFYTIPSTILAAWYIAASFSGLFKSNRLQNSGEFDRGLWGAGFLWTSALSALGLAAEPLEGITMTAILTYGLSNTFMIYIARHVINVLLADFFIENFILIGNDETEKELEAYFGMNPHSGWRLASRLTKFTARDFKTLDTLIIKKSISAIIIPNTLPKKGAAIEKIHLQIKLGIPLIDSHTLYEQIFGKLPLSEIEEGHFIENLETDAPTPSKIRNAIERLLAMALCVILLPLMIAIGLLIRLTSRGPALIRQTRTGELGRPFMLYKFRSMKADAERNGPQWSKDNDKRITTLGAFLRATHLDELPQLWNIAKGELAFIGPRPERPELIAVINKKVPHFELRNLIRPGLTGWTQIKFGYGASVEDAREKLRYDLYYLKHKSFFFDLSIALRTLLKFIP